ncbi:cytochrome b561 and DOMON domain-containing protein At5g35735-like isoform X2 [Punica granatum]|uniref:Cytochrome b561 and DOMON domain-containing protein At5g35735-like isoform X2 n=1 Tax=Punica granatum TaxID=22663 RepID=A0A6P8CDP0_PUNGR|nr:cytochrome b561 and DOMON domain-containing protein At5g35735-like isoform X2 [Punica granatum]
MNQSKVATSSKKNMSALACQASPTPVVPIFILILLFITHPVRSQSCGLCSEAFVMTAKGRNITHCKKLRTLDVELGWSVSSFNSQWTQIDVVFGTSFRSDTGWLSWGVNPLPRPQMIGTRAIISIRQPNGTLSTKLYNITRETKIKKCHLQPTTVDVEVRDMASSYIEEKQYFALSAVVIVPNSAYKVSKLNHVWQVGYEADGLEPKMHPMTLQNFDSTETLNLRSGESKDRGLKNHKHTLRLVHGILNIIGWGWAIGLILGSSSPYYTFHVHRWLAIFIFTLATLQMLAFLLKPESTDKHNGYRIWKTHHHSIGYTLLILIIGNIFRGIAILKPDNAVWNWVYIGILLLLFVVALILEIYSWYMYYEKKNKTNET